MVSTPVRKWDWPKPPAPARATKPSRVVLLASRGERSVNEEAFDELAERFLAQFRASRSHGFHALWVALEAASHELCAHGTIAQSQARRNYECACRDLTQMASLLVRGPRAGARALHEAEPDQGALVAMLRALRLSGDAIYRMAGETGRSRLRRVGDVTCAGSLTCTQCGSAVRSRYTTAVAPCSRCGGASFLKDF